MPDQDYTGFPRNDSAQGDEHSTTGDGHPPRTGQRANQGTPENRPDQTQEMKRQGGQGEQQNQSPGRE